MDNNTFFERLASEPECFFQDLYRQHHENQQRQWKLREQQSIYLNRAGLLHGFSQETRQQHAHDFLQFVVWQAWTDLTVKSERDKINLRYGTTEQKEEAKTLGEWFGLARGYLLTTRGSDLSPSERFKEAIDLANRWKRKEGFPPDKSPENTDSACMVEIFLALWISRSRDVARSYIRDIAPRNEIYVTPEGLEGNHPPQKEEYPPDLRFYQAMVCSVFRNEYDHIICEGKRNNQSEDDIAKQVNKSRVQIRKLWEQLMERARFLLCTHTTDEKYFPNVVRRYQGPNDFIGILECELQNHLKEEVEGWSCPERNTAQEFWIGLRSLREITEESDKTAKGVTNDWKRAIEKSSGSELRHELVFLWSRGLYRAVNA